MVNPVAIKRIGDTDWEVWYGKGNIKSVRRFTLVNGREYHVSTKYLRNPEHEPMRLITGTKILVSIGIFYLLVLAGPNILSGLGTLGNEFMVGLSRLLGG